MTERCRHDIFEDCPDCLREEIERLRSTATGEALHQWRVKWQVEHDRAKAAEAERDEARNQLVKARNEALEEAAKIARNGCLVPPDGGSPTEEEAEMCESIASQIRLRKLKGTEALFDDQQKE